MDDPGELGELNQLEELIRRKVDGELDEEGERVLRERLAADPSAGEAVERALALQRDLRDLSLSSVNDPGPELTDRVMAALPPERTRAWSFLTRPIPVPMWLAASLVVALAAGVWLLARPRPQVPAAPVAKVRCEPSPESLLVRFSLNVPGASRVNLVGDFNQWSREATPLYDHNGNGVWTISVPISPGRYQYKFLVDGERWMVDPDAPAHYPDGFGGRNSLLSI